MKTRVLLVYPEIPATYWSFKYALDFINKKTLMPPLGIITIASYFPKDRYDLTLVDLNVQPLTKQDVENADLVMVSAMIVQKASFKEIVDLCNKCTVPVAAGGPYPTNSYDKINGVDYFILNEGEVTLPQFIHDYEHGIPQKMYTSDSKPDIRLTLPPRFDLLDLQSYSTMALQNSRGCPFNCEFCDIIELFGRNPRYKEPSQFVNEMDLLYRAGYVGPLFIVDDNFIGHKRKVKELIRAIIVWQKQHSHPFTLFTEASIDLAQDEELIDLMVEAGFNMVFIGLETPDAELLEHTNKMHNVKVNMLDEVEKIQRKGIEVLAGFILGFDNEKDDIFDRQIEFIQSAGIPLAMVGMMMVLPNTQLYRRLEKEGRILGETQGDNTHQLRTNFIPTMPQEKLTAGYKKVLKTIYSPKKYFERCTLLFKRLPKQVVTSDKAEWEDVKPLIMSFLKQAFSRYGWYYLKFFVNALRYNKSQFPFAVNLAIKGYHFFKITKEILLVDEYAMRIDKSLQSVKKMYTSKYQTKAALEKAIKKINVIRKQMKKRYRLVDAEIQGKLSEYMDEYELEVDKLISRLISDYELVNGRLNFQRDSH